MAERLRLPPARVPLSAEFAAGADGAACGLPAATGEAVDRSTLAHPGPSPAPAVRPGSLPRAAAATAACRAACSSDTPPAEPEAPLRGASCRRSWARPPPGGVLPWGPAGAPPKGMNAGAQSGLALAPCAAAGTRCGGSSARWGGSSVPAAALLAAAAALGAAAGMLLAGGAGERDRTALSCRCRSFSSLWSSLCRCRSFSSLTRSSRKRRSSRSRPCLARPSASSSFQPPCRCAFSRRGGCSRCCTSLRLCSSRLCCSSGGSRRSACRPCSAARVTGPPAGKPC